MTTATATATATAGTALRPACPDPASASPAVPRSPRTLEPRPVALRPGTGPRLRLLRHEPEPDDPEPAAPAPTVRAVPPVADLRGTADLHRRAHQVLCLVLEVLHGRRSLAHLAPHLEPPALRYVRAASAGPPARSPSRLTSVHVSRPSIGAIEVAAVRRHAGRARAIAARFEGRPEEPARWRCVTLRLL